MTAATVPNDIANPALQRELDDRCFAHIQGVRDRRQRSGEVKDRHPRRHRHRVARREAGRDLVGHLTRTDDLEAELRDEVERSDATERDEWSGVDHQLLSLDWQS